MEHGNNTVILNDLLHTDFELLLNDYPIFDENYRNILNEKIINHYRFREIGFFSPDKFNFKLRTKMFEIMPYFNVIYKKLKSENYDIFSSNNYKETYEGDTNTLSNSENLSNQKGNNNQNVAGSNTDNFIGKNTFIEGEKTNVTLDSDTPQGNIDIANIENGGYLTKFQKNKSNSENDITNVENTNNSNSSQSTEGNFTNENKSLSKDNVNSTNNYVRLITGYQGVDQVDFITKYINNMIDIDVKIIEKLQDLFLLIY